MAAAKKPRTPKPPKAATPHAELHKDYVTAFLTGMFGRDTNLHHLQAVHAAKLSKAVRCGEMPLPDGTMPTPDDVRRIVNRIRGNSRPFTLALVAERWQGIVDEMTFGSPATGQPSYKRTGPAMPTTGDLL